MGCAILWGKLAVYHNGPRAMPNETTICKVAQSAQPTRCHFRKAKFCPTNRIHLSYPVSLTEGILKSVEFESGAPLLGVVFPSDMQIDLTLLPNIVRLPARTTLRQHVQSKPSKQPLRAPELPQPVNEKY